MALDQRQLRAFLAVVDSGSLGRAAESINLSQPALSRLIQDMETRLDARLFERHGRGMTLTGFGEALLPHARLLLFEIGQARDALAALKGLKRGAVRVGVVASIARTLLPAAVDRLLRAAPDLTVELVEAEDDRLAAALDRREVDLAIARNLSGHDDVEAIAECLFDDSYSVVCAADHPLARKERVTLEDLAGERWVSGAPGATPRALFNELLRKAGGAPPVVSVETWSPNAAIAFVSRTHLLGWLPRPLFRAEETAGIVRALDVPALSLPRRFFAYKRARGLLPPAAQRLLDELPLAPLAPGVTGDDRVPPALRAGA